MTQRSAAPAMSQICKSKHSNQNGHQLPTPTVLHRAVCWNLIRHIRLPRACTNTHTHIENCGEHSVVHFHTKSKQPFGLNPPSGSQTSCCHCSSVKRRRAELWLSASCHCMCVQLQRGPGVWAGIPAASTPLLFLLPIPQERGALDLDCDLVLPSCSATSHTCSRPPSFTVVKLVKSQHKL